MILETKITLTQYTRMPTLDKMWLTFAFNLSFGVDGVAIRPTQRGRRNFGQTGELIGWEADTVTLDAIIETKSSFIRLFFYITMAEVILSSICDVKPYCVKLRTCTPNDHVA